jgi:tetratricopeptide (TPR) repeat protein
MRKLTVIVALVLGFACAPARAQEASAGAKQKARVHIKKARGLYEAGKLDQAVIEYEAAFGIFANPDIMFNIGQIRRAQEDRPKALAAYRKYLELAADGTHAQEARELSEQMRREIVPESLRARFDAVKNRYQKYKEEKGGALDDEWAAIDAQIAAGDTDGLGAKIDALDADIDKRTTAPPPPLAEEGKKAVAKTEKKHKPFAPISLPPYAKKWWFWTAVGGGAAALVLAITLGVTLGGPQHDPTPTLGVLSR